MLVLSRKVGDRILIGSAPNQVEVVVTRIVGNRVCVGVIAPPEVPIRRGELEPKEPGPEVELVA